MRSIKKYILLMIVLFGIFYNNRVEADVIVGEKYEVKKALNIEKRFSMYNINENITSDAEEKLDSMNGYKVIIPKTNENYELALAYSDGSFTFYDTAETLEEGKEKLRNINIPKSEELIVPSIIGKSGQVVYATNSMGRIWKHLNNEPDLTVNNNTYVYSKEEKVGIKDAEYTYINHGYIDDVPIIEDKGSIAKIQVNGYEGWVNKDDKTDDYDLVVVPINQVTDPSCYLVKNGYIYHYITRNMTSSTISGNFIMLGPAPNYLEEGKDYYSYDGVYFYEGNTIQEGLNKLITDLKNNVKDNAMNKDKPYYNYYQYLPFRTRTNYTSEDLNKVIAENTDEKSKLRGMGETLIESQKLYGVNALLTLAVAINESSAVTEEGSSWGMSDLAQYNNNLFGIGAIDFAPNGADIFKSPGDSIKEFTKNYISSGYCNPDDYRFYGGYLGNKSLGANVKYASDPYWGEKAAQFAFLVDLKLSNGDVEKLKDFNGYQLAMYKSANQVISKNNTVLYNINPIVSGYGGYAGNIIAFVYEEKQDKGYEIFPEVGNPINGNGESDYKGEYNWNERAYINYENIELINSPKSSFIPGYKKQDVNKDYIVDIYDMSQVALKYNFLSNEDGFLKRLDLNLDGIIDIFDIILISKEI